MAKRKGKAKKGKVKTPKVKTPKRVFKTTLKRKSIPGKGVQHKVVKLNKTTSVHLKIVK